MERLSGRFEIGSTRDGLERGWARCGRWGRAPAWVSQRTKMLLTEEEVTG